MTITTVLGAGAMGTACAWVLAQNEQRDVGLWGRSSEHTARIRETRRNERLLQNVQLPGNVLVTSDAAEALSKTDVVLVCIPMKGLREVLSDVAGQIPKRALMVSTIKGIEVSTLRRPSQIIQEFCPENPIVALGGPCHAEEVVERKPASIVAASATAGAAEQLQALLSTDFLRVYVNADLVGVELGGALKNVIAIAAGICDGLEFGDNAKAALLTRGLNEMVRFGKMMGADPRTFYGLAGLGDLVTTCNSRHSRNRHVGECLGKGLTLADIERSMSAVAEGVLTTRSVHQLAATKQIDMPIAGQVYAVLFEGKSPREATEELMNRPLKSE